VELSQCAEEVDLFNKSKLQYRTDLQVNIFLFLKVGLTQKHHLFLPDFLYEECKASRSYSYVIFFNFLEAPHRPLPPDENPIAVNII
jgi:hypothetical protein